MKSDLFSSIQNYCEEVEQNFDSIKQERKQLLLNLSEYITGKLADGESAKIIVICTHNSRRSHLGQIWLSVAADYYGVTGIQTFSGGTEATAFNPNAIQALEKVGFGINADDKETQNPRYSITWSEDQKPYVAFSKKYEEAPNPASGFVAVMVCSEADEGCPFVPGTDFRLSLPFDDPKAFDGTDQQDQKYDERCREIATQMLFVLKHVQIA